jgi:hypothetical protein
MHWIIQNNLFDEDAINKTIEILDRFSIPYTTVKVIPFGGGIEPEVTLPDGQIVMVIGSISLVKYAKDHGWKGGVFINENFDYKVQSSHYKDHMLNNELYCRFDEVATKTPFDPFFCRPVLDDKSFAGRVFTRAEFAEWANMIAKGDTSYTIQPDTEVIVAEPTNIHAEYRCLVIDGRVVTASQYRMGSLVLYSNDVPPEVYEYANSVIATWQPDRAFTIDIARLGNGFRVIELNNINSAGWYHCDVSKIIQAIEGMEF